MPAPLTIPVGELTSLGLAKESTFNTFAAPTFFHAFESASFTPTNLLVTRTGARKRLGQTLPVAGGFQGKASLAVEPDPDTLGQLLYFSMGTQAAPVTGANVVATTLTGTASAGSNVVCSLASMDNIYVGCKLTFAGGTPETQPVASLDYGAKTVTIATLSNTHNNGTAVTSPSSCSAYFSKLSMGNPLPSFSAELYRITDGVRYTGCKVSGMAFKMDKSKGLSVSATCEYASETRVSSGAVSAATFSTLVPLTFENSVNGADAYGTMVGASGQATVLSWDISVANNLMAGYYSFGNGRTVVDFPGQQRKISGKVSLGFENSAAYQNFLGSASATTPQATVPGIGLDFRCASTDLADATNVYPYAVHFKLPNVFLTAHSVPVNSTGVITQDFSWEAAESANAAQDDMTLNLINLQTTSYT